MSRNGDLSYPVFTMLEEGSRPLPKVSLLGGVSIYVGNLIATYVALVLPSLGFNSLATAVLSVTAGVVATLFAHYLQRFCRAPWLRWLFTTRFWSLLLAIWNAGSFSYSLEVFTGYFSGVIRGANNFHLILFLLPFFVFQVSYSFLALAQYKMKGAERIPLNLYFLWVFSLLILSMLAMTFLFKAGL